MSELIVEVGDLVGYAGKTKTASGTRDVSLRLGQSTIKGPMHVEAELAGTTDGVQADFEVTARANLVCVRCLTEWEEELAVEGSQHYSIIPDEDGYAIEGSTIDLSGPAQDELALGIPATPLCSEDCKGLCPICGTDLNRDPCDGHGEESDSPFAVLRDLFDS